MTASERRSETASHAVARCARRERLKRRLIPFLLVLLVACGDTSIEPPAPSNQAPAASGTIPGQSLEAGGSVTLSVASYFRDPDGDPLVYAATTSSAAVVTASVSGSDVTLTAVGAGNATVTVTARDPGGSSAQQSIAVTVTQPNQAPVATDTIPDQSMSVGDTVRLSLAGHFSDPDGDALVYEATTSSAAVVTASVSGSDVTLAGVGAGDATVTVTARDPAGSSAEQSIAVTVNPPGNRAPVVADSVPDQSMSVGDSVKLNLANHFSDPDGDSLVYEAATLNPNVVKTSVAGSEVTLMGVGVGTAMVTVAATDPDRRTGLQRVNVVVSPRQNASPVATGSISDYSVEVGRVVRLDVASYFSDPDGDPLMYDITSLNPDVVSVSAEGSVATMTARAVDGTPVETTVRVVAKDPYEGTARIEFEFAVGGRDVRHRVDVPRRRDGGTEDGIPASQGVLGAGDLLRAGRHSLRGERGNLPGGNGSARV